MKKCNHCNEVKPSVDYYKMSASKDGLQPKCKDCCRLVNQSFRDTKPDYQNKWYRKNMNKWITYLSAYAKENLSADDSRSALYVVINPAEQMYVGMTQTAFSRRKQEHKQHYKHGLKKQIPLLYDSFDKYGWDNHKWYVFKMPGTDREALKRMESNLIEKVQKTGKSLNIRLK